MNAFEGKTVLITGSSRGIGAATARLVHECGGHVILHARTASDELKQLATELSADYLTCDAADTAAIHHAVAAQLQKTPQIHALINNAGTGGKPEKLLEITDDAAIDLFRVNVLGAIHFSQAVIPSMQQHRYGRIVNTASIRGHYTMASVRIPMYSATKAALVALTSSMAKELAPHITVNAVSPGMTITEMSKGWTDAVWDQAKSNLVGGAARADEQAEVIAFLASDGASHINGQTIIVDGGYEISGK